MLPKLAPTSSKRLRPSSLWRLPRKHVIRLRKEILAASLLFIALSLFLRTLHPSAHKKYESIEPRYSLKELSEIPRNVYYLKKEPVIYCYIPKNACSALKPIIRKREGFADWKNQHMVHGKRNGLQRLLWLNRKDALVRLNDSSIYRFVVVRDPFSRLVSAYQNKVATPWPDQRDDFWNVHLRRECPSMIDAMTIPAKGALLSFEEFLECLNAPDTIHPSNEHWRSQSELCGLDHIKYDKYIHVEEFADGVKELFEELKWNEDINQFDIDRKPVYEHELSTYFSEKALQLALRYYEDDFEILRYPKLPQGKIGFFSVFNGTNFHPDFKLPIDNKPPTHEST